MVKKLDRNTLGVRRFYAKNALKADKDQRREGLYRTDRFAPFKRSEYNPVVKSAVEGYSEEELHHLLHVEYKTEK